MGWDCCDFGGEKEEMGGCEVGVEGSFVGYAKEDWKVGRGFRLEIWCYGILDMVWGADLDG